MSEIYSDGDAFEAIEELLRGTGAFSTVAFAVPAELDMIGADRLPAAVVMPLGWSETRDVDGGAIRHVSYVLTLLVRAEDGHERFRGLDELAQAARAAIEGSDLDGGCLTELTRLGQGRYELGLKRQEGRLVVSGAFAYPITGVTSPEEGPNGVVG